MSPKRIVDGILIMGMGMSLQASAGEAVSGKPGAQTAHSLDRVLDERVRTEYLLYLPPEYEGQGESNEPWPLVLFLHGAGERGEDLERVKAHGPPKLVAQGRELPFILVSPQCPEGQIWKPRVLSGLLDEVTARYRVDPDRVYVTGLSMGGYGTWELAAAYPDRFAAVAPICGGGSRIWAWPLRQLPVWAFHGAEDPVVPPEESERMIERLKEDGAEAKLTLYPGVGHNSWEEAYGNPELYAWLLKHTRDTNP